MSQIGRMAIIAFLSLLSTSGGVSAETKPAAGFAGKVLRIIVGYPSGSGFDVYARAVSRHLGSHIPGQPTVIV